MLTSYILTSDPLSTSHRESCKAEAPHDGGWKRMQKNKENEKEMLRNLVEFQENPVNDEELP